MSQNDVSNCFGLYTGWNRQSQASVPSSFVGLPTSEMDLTYLLVVFGSSSKKYPPLKCTVALSFLLHEFQIRLSSRIEVQVGLPSRGVAFRLSSSTHFSDVRELKRCLKGLRSKANSSRIERTILGFLHVRLPGWSLSVRKIFDSE